MALDWIVRRSIDRDPGLPFVISSGDEQVPIAGKSCSLETAGHIRAEETAGGTSCTATNRLRKNDIDNALAGPDIEIANPGRAVVLTDRDVGVVPTFLAAYIAKIGG